MKEYDEQKTFVEWLRLKGLLFYHVANERDCSYGTRVWLRKIGLAPGVPDICICHANADYHGLYIEMKSSKGKMSHDQAYWVEMLNEHGYRAEVAYGAGEAIKITEGYMGWIK